MANSKQKILKFEIDDEGFQKLLKSIKSVKNGAEKKRAITKVLKRQMKAIEVAVRANTPVRGSSTKAARASGKAGHSFKKGELAGGNIAHARLTKRGQSLGTKIGTDKKGNPKMRMRGNLKNSIGQMVDRRRIGVRVAPRKGKRKRYDGFYGWWHVYGWTPFIKDGKSKYGKRIPPNDFIWKAAAPLLPAVARKMSTETATYIKNLIKKKML